MKNLTPSKSHYIKAVYELSSDSQGVRVVDIAEKLGVSKASTSLSMTKLVQQDIRTNRDNLSRQVEVSNNR